MPRSIAMLALSTVLVLAAMPTGDLGWPIWVALAPACVALRPLSWRRRLLWGFVLGWLVHMVLFRWIIFSLREMSSLPDTVGLLALALFSIWHAAPLALFAWLGEPVRRYVTRWHIGLGPLGIASTFVAVEWLTPTLFEMPLGAPLWTTSSWSSVAALTGSQGLSFMVVLCAALLAELWCLRGPRTPTRLIHHLGAGAAVLSALLLFGAAWSQYLETAPSRSELRIGVIQPNWTLEEKKRMTAIRRLDCLRRLERMIRDIPAGQYDLLVASEGAFTMLWDVEGARGPNDQVAQATEPTRTIQRAVADGPATHLIIGGLRRPKEGKTRNSAVHIDPKGRLLGHYDKQILMPFGEYLPGSSLFPSLRNAIKGISDFDAGNTPCRFEVGDELVACGICYETLLAGQTRADIGDAQLLINLTIDVWFGDTEAPALHVMVHALRAAELGVPLIRSALTGVTAIVGPDGVVDAALPMNTEGLLEGKVAVKSVVTPYRRFGPWFAWLCTAVIFGLLILIRREHVTR